MKSQDLPVESGQIEPRVFDLGVIGQDEGGRNCFLDEGMKLIFRARFPNTCISKAVT